jgi:hypothetical protein
VPSGRKLAAYVAARDRHGHSGAALVGRAPFAMAEAQVAAARLIAEGAGALNCASERTIAPPSGTSHAPRLTSAGSNADSTRRRFNGDCGRPRPLLS